MFKGRQQPSASQGKQAPPSQQAMTLLLVDEIDILMTKDQSVRRGGGRQGGRSTS